MEKKSIFESKEQYLEFKTNWKQYCLISKIEGNPKLTFEHFILYAMLRGKDWKKCIAESSTDKTIELANYIANDKDFKYLSLWPFGKTITEDMLDETRNMECN